MITSCYSDKSINNGGVRVGAPLGVTGLINGVDYGNYVIDTYSMATPTTGNVNTAYAYEYNQDVVRTAVLGADAETKELVAAVAGRQIEVVSYVMVASAATTATFKSATTAISSGITLAGSGGVSSTNNQGLMTTALGEALQITNSAGTINGHISYKIN